METAGYGYTLHNACAITLSEFFIKTVFLPARSPHKRPTSRSIPYLGFLFRWRKKAKTCVGYLLPSDIRYNERSSAERVNANLKDNHGGRTLRVRGGGKVMCHLMFGIVVIAATQILRLVT